MPPVLAMASTSCKQPVAARPGGCRPSPVRSVAVPQRCSPSLPLLAVATLASGSYVGRVSRPLPDHVARLGVVSYELAGSTARSVQIRDSWRARGVLDQARGSLIWDVPFTLSYSSLMYGTVRCSGGARWVAAGQLVAGACDLAEGVALWQALHGRPRPWARIAQMSATTKFALLGVGLAELTRQGLAAMRRKGSRPVSSPDPAPPGQAGH